MHIYVPGGRGGGSRGTATDCNPTSRGPQRPPLVCKNCYYNEIRDGRSHFIIYLNRRRLLADYILVEQIFKHAQ